MLNNELISLKVLVEKVNSMQNQLENFSRAIHTIGEKMKLLKIKNNNKRKKECLQLADQ